MCATLLRGAERIVSKRMTPMASVDVDMVKCACPDCVCVVSVTKAVKRDEKAFCCDECAEGHPDHAGCDHAGCSCHG
ncbi:metallothionein family 14 [Methylorubrum extorquens PA1]|nr:metallothionein family 14 [Methylorubrum extorquens PA1]